MNRIPSIDDVIRIGDKELIVIETDTNVPNAYFLVAPFSVEGDGTGTIPVSPKNVVCYTVKYDTLELVCTVGAKSTTVKLSDVSLLGKATCMKLIKVVKFKAV